MAEIRLRMLDTGYCLASEHHVFSGGAQREMHCHALVGLLQHPTYGYTLFDAGYAPRMLTATEHWPWRLYRSLTPLRLDPELALAVQLPRIGVQPAAIRRVIVSHFHADHVAGLRDFPNATIITTVEALVQARTLRGIPALFRGLLPDLLPPDLLERVELLPAFGNHALPGLGPTHDLFGDGSVRLVHLPGHACGQIGALVRTTEGPVLLAADGAWTRRSIRERRPPALVTYLLVDDARCVRTTIDGLHAFMVAHPEVRIIPTHCPEAYEECCRA
jgi:glyoxylase-like metal-dependent hydrolase (beta-lactamase superfamily II)